MSRNHCDKHKHHHPGCQECRLINKELKRIAATEARIEQENKHIEQNLDKILKLLARQPVSAVITQGAKPMLTPTILGLAPGTSDNFFVTPTDVNGNADALPAGSPTPKFSTDDAGVILVDAPDGLSTNATAPGGATPGGSFNLRWDASYTDLTGNPASISSTANVPYLAPPVLLPTGGVISQGAPAV